jgi:Leu/Phe-tRNA-protein transferase
VGAYYNLHGDRAKAEELFDRSFAQASVEVWHTVNLAGSYLGVETLR